MLESISMLHVNILIRSVISRNNTPLLIVLLKWNWETIMIVIPVNLKVRLQSDRGWWGEWTSRWLIWKVLSLTCKWADWVLSYSPIYTCCCLLGGNLLHYCWNLQAKEAMLDCLFHLKYPCRIFDILTWLWTFFFS